MKSVPPGQWHYSDLLGRVAIAGLLVALIAGCSNAMPAPVYYGRGNAERSAVSSNASVTVTVRKGENLYRIAQRTGISLRALIEANGLQPPYTIYPGQKLVVPTPKVHRVERGETVYGISRRYGIDMHSLAQSNGLGPPYTIHVGQTLRIPSAMIARASTRPDPGLRTSTARTAPAAGAKGTAGTIAGPTSVPPSRSTAKPPVPAPPPRSGSKFSWPVRGKIISGFGPKKDGLHNDGVNIAVSAGTEVRAAENGVVAYSGNELRGYGNLLLVRHADGWMTAYAHNSRLLVNRGDKISRGQVIAQSGQSGGVSPPQVHFEVRKGSQAVDPLRYLPTS